MKRWVSKVSQNDKIRRVDQKNYFDQIEEGHVFHFGQYILEREEIICFARQWDPQPFHIDEEAAKQSIFGGLTASSLQLFAICTKLFASYKPPFAILAMLGKDELRIPSPAHVGDTLIYDSRCISSRPSSSKPDRGVIVLDDQVMNQSGDIVLSQKVTLLLAKSP